LKEAITNNKNENLKTEISKLNENMAKLQADKINEKKCLEEKVDKLMKIISNKNIKLNQNLEEELQSSGNKVFEF
jgi:uncharacterized protein YlxW (UPF0749 family)